MYTIQDICPGTSWACKFRTTTFLDSTGTPVLAQLQVGQAHPGTPGTYTSTGVIKTRDLDNNLLRVVDVATGFEFTVSTTDCWDIDTVEYV